MNILDSLANTKGWRDEMAGWHVVGMSTMATGRDAVVLSLTLSSPMAALKDDGFECDRFECMVPMRAADLVALSGRVGRRRAGILHGLCDVVGVGGCLTVWREGGG